MPRRPKPTARLLLPNHLMSLKRLPARQKGVSMSEQTIPVKASEVRGVSRMSYGELARRTLTVAAVCAAWR